MIRLDTYLNFNGNTEQVFNFYKKVFKSEFSRLMRFSDMPGSEKMIETDKQKILHIALPIGDSNLMGTDSLDSLNQKLTMGDNFSISISLDDENETKRIFEELSEDGLIVMPLGRESWSELFGICKDKFDVQWMINYNSTQN
ncbi:MAG: VOC family protein [Chitinophagaceae bacterium]|nr:MAG: VOC family protein [Chitinophagaceae bacterium]